VSVFRVVVTLCALRALAMAEPAQVDGGVAAPSQPSAPSAPAAWAALSTPGPGRPQSIGRYGGGCIDGAARLPLKGTGYAILHPERARLFGHPLLVAFLTELGKSLRTLKLPTLYIGDLGQIRGGPAPTGHASHQTGLDVDLAYLAPASNGGARSLVDLAKSRILPGFSPAVIRMLAVVASSPSVDRVFINPVIKRVLCTMPSDAERPWLRKLRPWWGHHDHFHVRLACPADSPACEAQTPLPPGDGCEGLDWWFKKGPDHDSEKKNYQARVGAAPPLPAPCSKLLTQ